ncbi:hypothetical protein BA188_02490 [Aeromonas hydrophila]|nr:hypothetical protein OI72_10435 [Aeromonas hydrophila]OFC47354.1 hypothetical protein BA189_09380 [Aeromonas hydrophila]OFC50798.1 hypothetical protein BA188_02490 [Aeromonas hydrophila]
MILIRGYYAPSPFSTNCRPSGVSDPIKLSTSWLVVFAEGLKVWANYKVATQLWPHSASVHWQ